MKKALIAATAAAAALVAAPAMAQDMNVQWYGSLGYGHFDADDVELGAVQGRLGARFGEWFGVEGEAAVGVNDDSFAGADVSLNHQAAIYAVGFAPLSPSFDLIGRVGVGTTDVDFAGADFDDDSINYGVGAQWNWDEANAIRGDWTRHDFDEGETDVWSLAYVRKF